MTDTETETKPKKSAAAKSNSAERLRSFIDRITRLEEERKDLQADIKEVLTEAESEGFDKTAIKAVIKIRTKGRDSQLEGVINTYLESLGELPLFQWASH